MTKAFSKWCWGPLWFMSVIAVACSSSAGVVEQEPTLVPTTPTTLKSTSTTAPDPSTTTSVARTTTTILAADDLAVSEDYIVETVAAGIDAGTGGLAVDADGNLYHADFGYPEHVGDSIFKVTPDGEVSVFATSEFFNSLTGNTFGPDGLLYQSSYGSSTVTTIDSSGTVTLLTESIRGPTGIVVTNDGRVFVESCRTNQVFEVLTDGTTEVIASGVGMNCPNGMTIDDEGNLYVVNFSSGFMQRITPEGEIEVIHRFASGNAHVVHDSGFLYITARVDNRVFRYDIATGEVVVIAGTNDEGTSDGPGAEATISRPNAIAIGPDGSLYINHGEDGRNDPTWIRRITQLP